MDRRIGAHDVEVDGDILKLTVRGVFTLEDMKQFTAVADTHAMPLGYLLVLNDVTAATGLTADARRYSADRVRETKRKGPLYAASASFGAGTIVRGMVALFYAVLRLTSNGDHLNRMVKSESEARAFLAEQRRYFQTQLPR